MPRPGGDDNNAGGIAGNRRLTSCAFWHTLRATVIAAPEKVLVGILPKP